MRTLVLDIETIGEEWNALDEIAQENLLRWAKRSAKNKEELGVLEQDVKNNLGFSPLTGQIIAIGLYDLERKRGLVYYQGDADDEFEENGFTFRKRTEPQMLKHFWEGALEYDTFVTFNGRRFDAPFLALRSMVHEIRPTKNLMEGRYLYQQKITKHIDLLDQLTFYGAMYRRPSLYLFARAFGIESPKQTGLHGGVVEELFQNKKFLEIARYNAWDVVATTQLYKKWLAHFGPQDEFDIIE